MVVLFVSLPAVVVEVVSQMPLRSSSIAPEGKGTVVAAAFGAEVAVASSPLGPESEAVVDRIDITLEQQEEQKTRPQRRQ